MRVNFTRYVTELISTCEIMDGRGGGEGRKDLRVRAEPGGRRRVSQEFKDLCRKFEGGIESDARKESIKDFYYFKFLPQFTY